MSISFPLSAPDMNVRQFSLIAQNQTAVSTSPFTGQQQVYEWPGEFWLLKVSLPPMKRADAEQWIAFLTSLRGSSGTFYFGDPYGKTPQGVATGTPKVNGSNAAGSKTVNTKGWTHSITGILKAGDYLSFGGSGGLRLYKVLKDANSDSSGNVTLDIFPRLREALSGDQTIFTTNCKGIFRLSDNTREFSIDLAGIYGLGFTAVEAI
jgi:hypothetical protein